MVDGLQGRTPPGQPPNTADGTKFTFFANPFTFRVFCVFQFCTGSLIKAVQFSADVMKSVVSTRLEYQTMAFLQQFYFFYKTMSLRTQ